MSVSPPCAQPIQTAVHGLYVDHHAWLVTWLTRRLRNAAEAADLAQDTFLRVLGREAETISGLRGRVYA